MSLVMKRGEAESWLECALRYAKSYNLEEEVTVVYNAAIKRGEEEKEAAFEALYEWDLLDLETP